MCTEWLHCVSHWESMLLSPGLNIPLILESHRSIAVMPNARFAGDKHTFYIIERAAIGTSNITSGNQRCTNWASAAGPGGIATATPLFLKPNLSLFCFLFVLTTNCHPSVTRQSSPGTAKYWRRANISERKRPTQLLYIPWVDVANLTFIILF